MKVSMRTQFISMMLIIALAAVILAGCGGSNQVIVRSNGEVEKIALLPDSIPAQEFTGEYFIGYGDVLDVVFLYNREYSRENLQVRPDGRISFPYVGELSAAGKTVGQLDSLLTAKYSEIIRDPDITVIVREFEPQTFYVLGEVNKPGSFKYQKSQTLVGALATSGGLKRSANESSVIVVRRIAHDHVIGIEVDVDHLFDENRYDLDIPLRPFDIVMVPKDRLTSTEEFITSMYNIIVKPIDLYLKGWNVANVQTLYEFYRNTGQVR